MKHGYPMQMKWFLFLFVTSVAIGSSPTPPPGEGVPLPMMLDKSLLDCGDVLFNDTEFREERTNTLAWIRNHNPMDSHQIKRFIHTTRLSLELSKLLYQAIDVRQQSIEPELASQRNWFVVNQESELLPLIAALGEVKAGLLPEDTVGQIVMRLARHYRQDMSNDKRAEKERHVWVSYLAAFFVQYPILERTFYECGGQFQEESLL